MTPCEDMLQAVILSWHVIAMSSTESPPHTTSGVDSLASKTAAYGLQPEWPTLLLILGCTLAILLLSRFAESLPLWASVPLLSMMLVLHSSLQHEVLHGHPFKNTSINELLVFVPFGLFVSYRRFRDTHLQHHIDENLTDPHDDPESNYLDPAVWRNLPAWIRAMRRVNNTLAGRVVIGPALGMYYFYRTDLRLILSGDRAVINAYIAHFAGMLPLVWWMLTINTMPVWVYLMCAYLCLSLLRVRTFLEHQAHELVPCRTVIIEDRGLIAQLFLNNNFHLVHHMNPSLAWYKLPALYQSRREQFIARNQGYVFKNYWQIISRYLFKCKDPVPHPLR